MAHTVCGIDLGAYSIKLAFLEAGFRATTLRGLEEISVPEGEAPLVERQMAAVREGLARVPGEVTPYVAVAGDQLSVRVLELPFTDARKIDQVVGYELEGQIVHALDDVVFDHVTVRSGDDGSHVLAVAARRDVVGAWLDTLKADGIDPRALYAAPVVYHMLDIVDPAADRESGRVPAILDLGHQRTNLFLGRDGQAITARAITRGGAALTTALAETLGIDRGRAEQIKRSEARLVPTGAGPVGAAEMRLDHALRTALAPLIREVRQTLASFRASSRLEVNALYVTGGTARLKGILPFLEEELGLPALYLTVPNTLQGVAPPPTRAAPKARAAKGGDGEGADTGVDEVSLEETTRFSRQASESSSFALATAIGLAVGSGGREIDLRRGPFLYRASFSILRQKAGRLVLLAASILVAAGLDFSASLSNLRTERKALDARLKTATQEVFGAPRTDAKAVAQTLRKGFKEELAPVPKATAYDLLDQISKKMPAADKIKLDIAELDIKPKKTFIKGTVDSATAVDEIAEKLKEIECYDEVTKGAVTEVAGETKQFTLNVGAKCP
jgi:general secretion pathway protein L